MALILSNQTAPLPNGTAMIASNSEFATVEAKVQELTLGPIQAYDAGQKPSPADLKNLRAASDMVDRMTAFQPLASNFFFLSGKIHQILGEPQLAERGFRQCLLLYPADAESRPTERVQIVQTGAEAAYRLSLLLFSHGQIKDALQSADAAVKAFPNAPNYLVARAAALNELRRVDAAKKDLMQALALDPKNANAAALLRFISH